MTISFNRRTRLRLSFGAGFILLITVTAHGQSPRGQRDLSNAERNVRQLEMGTDGPKDTQTVLAEVNEDFARFREINEQFKAAVEAVAPLDVKSITDTSLEMKKRGNRLRVNLAGLPKADKNAKHEKQPTPATEAEMKSLLSNVSAVMTSFLGNPVFSDMGTLDNQLAAKARTDLDYLIDVTEVLKKGAEKIAKATRQ